MANELRSTFLRSKMNKDLDARIVPPGEYRDGENIAISRSEGADVGALENVLGNRIISDFNITQIGVETIGMYTDNGNNRIFLFMTNYTDTSSDRLSNNAPKESFHSIFVYNFNDDNFEQLVEGHFLNFSKTHPLYGINLLEELLFFTDNRNQPRRIDISKALNAPATSPNPYYQLEENVSVAKYYPFSTPYTYEEVTVTVKVRTTLLVQDGSNLNAGFPGGLSINAVTDQPENYPQTKWNTMCEIQGDLPDFTLHPGLKFYVKSSDTGLDRFTTWPYYNEIKNYPIQWGMTSLQGGGAATPFPWTMYNMSTAPNPRAEYVIEDLAGPNRWMTISQEYASNPNALYRAVNGSFVDKCTKGVAGGVVQDIPSVDYQENYLKWFYTNIPFLDRDTGEAWSGDAELVFIIPKLRNKTDKWLPSTYRIQLNDIIRIEPLEELPFENKSGIGLASNGTTEEGDLGIEYGSRPANTSWLPRVTLGGGVKNQTWLDNEMVLFPSLTTPLNLASCLTDYQKSVSNGLFRVVLDDLNGYGIGPRAPGNPVDSKTTPLRTYGKWYFQPGMRIDCPAFIDDNLVLVIDQIFPQGGFPDFTDNPNAFLISVHGEDREGNFLPYWNTPDLKDYIDAGLWLDLSFSNPYYEENFGGDTFFLDEKFCRLAYRFKFESGEYSLISPFTQCLFKPKNNGYYLKDKRKWDYDNGGIAFFNTGDAEPLSDVEKVAQSTLNGLYENSLDQIKILINSPVIGTENIAFNELGGKLKVESLEIIFTESDSTALRLLKSIPVTDPTIANNNTTVYTYTWDGDKPFSTLPSSEVTRVYDKVPIRALAQEVAGNRVIYGNFVDRHSSPEFLNYDVGISRKYNVNDEFTNFTTESYPNHTVKQNRSYQVGVVLADKYGRQSDVILSPTEISTTSVNTELFSGDTFKAKYLTMEQAVSTIPEGRNIVDWVGNSIKMLFNDVIPNEVIGLEGYPGLYTEEGGVSSASIDTAGGGYTTAKNLPTIAITGIGQGLTVDIVDDGAGGIDTIFINSPGFDYEVGDTVEVDQNGNVTGILEILEITPENPLGWYSYKIVVKQQEQDYYNLYLPQILNGEPLENYNSTVAGQVLTPFLDSKFVATSIGDNVNKIPREVNESNELVTYVTSKTKLFPRVSQYGGVRKAWALFGTESWEFIDDIKTGNVFNDEDPDGVINLGTFNNIYNSNSTTTPSFTVKEFMLFKQQDNPYITIGTNSPNRSPFLLPFQYNDVSAPLGPSYTTYYERVSVNIDAYIEPSGVGEAYFSTTPSSISMGAFNSGIGVIETSPFVSEIDIFYETSTSGKIKDLNYLIQTNVDENIPYSIEVINSTFDEATYPLYWRLWEDGGFAPPLTVLPTVGSDPWISYVTPKNAAGLTIALGDIVSIEMTVEDSTGADRTLDFLISNNATGTSDYGVYILEDALPYFEAPGQTHDFTFQVTVETVPEIPTDPNNVGTFTFNRSYTNNIPTLTSAGSNPRGLPGGPAVLTASETGVVWGEIDDGVTTWGSDIKTRNGAFVTGLFGTAPLGRPEYCSQQLKWSIVSCINQTDLLDYKNNLAFTNGVNGLSADAGAGLVPDWSNFQAIEIQNPIPAGDYELTWKVIDANDNDNDGGQLTYEFPTTGGFAPIQFTIDP